jgi:hypothetical protein
MSWIKVRTNLPHDPRVIWIAESMKLSRAHVVGLLVELWAYADQHSVDGFLRRMNPDGLDAVIGMPGFMRMLQEIDWAKVDSTGVTLNRYNEHNGQTAKGRAQNAVRVTAHRAKKAGAERSCNARRVTREEKRREDKSESEREKKGRRSWM